MKMILSIPRTISRAVKVTSATHASGLVSHSNIIFPFRLGLYLISAILPLFCRGILQSDLNELIFRWLCSDGYEEEGGERLRRRAWFGIGAESWLESS